MLCGAPTAAQPGNADVQAIADQIKGAAEASLGATYTKFNVHSYTSQVVAGTNYHLKVEVDNGFIHAKVFQSMPHEGSTVTLNSAEAGKTEADAL